MLLLVPLSALSAKSVVSSFTWLCPIAQRPRADTGLTGCPGPAGHLRRVNILDDRKTSIFFHLHGITALYSWMTCNIMAWLRRGVLYEPVQFIREFLADELEFEQVKNSVSVHVPCSSKQMGIHDDFLALAGLCAKEVVDSGASALPFLHVQ